ncbi:acyl-CoA synthetase [Agaricus bisporus var. bisporus H97]|uniref:acyl-CoA synthetase n=1 Tax=Agaricus bisporus var. bisporus (strain H97 / ATCC MYA-4626 / FGSC 10389) TaxID=936046 RepID=UPI00029F5C82|nr:acyl-CoA synthetase [Agaricus bisporus var. bisporus H97]EKV47575.1 acyl-CoA synthetase [Agaricus bisporus var. bisporus H97]
MPQKIYSSILPPLQIPNESVFTHLFHSNDPSLVGSFSASLPAYIDASTGTTLTRGQVKQFALELGYGLRTHFGARRGDTVLVYSPNSIHWPVVVFGAVAAGLRCTLANSAYNAKELAFQYIDSGAKIVFTTQDGFPVLRQTFQQIGISEAEADERIVILSPSLKWAGGPDAPRSSDTAHLLELADLLGKGSLLTEERFDGQDANETVYLCYSSGTTGKPKGVETTHKNIISVLKIVRDFFCPFYLNDKVLAILPFYHIYGAVKILHYPFTQGTPTVIMSKFDPVQFCAAIEKYKINIALVVPPVLVVLARHPAVDQYDLSSLRCLFSGAAPLGAALTKAVNGRLESKRTNGLCLFTLQGYGLTETSPTTHIQPWTGSHKNGSIGLLLPNLEARLVVDDNGEIDAEEGKPGELWLRGPSVMKGYLNRPDATKDAITPDKWFKTGDIAIRDHEGYFYIVDRRKELIKYNGFQVPPAELESVLLAHPDIADAAVIGVESVKQATELPRAYVVHARPEEVKLESQKQAFSQHVKMWIQEKVARHKYLRGGVVIVDVVPKSAAGKILRREIRDRAKEELRGRDPADEDVNAKL